jgi:tetratricopeptide (TPR) repeat protein
MKPALAVRATLLSAAIALSLAGCSDSDEMSQEEIQYLSHIDQSRFFQRQGELKASTLEARSAIELQPDKVEPYFLIVDNLLKAGDAANAERHLNQIMEQIPAEKIDSKVQNRANLILAEANFLQEDFEGALDALGDISSQDRNVRTQAALIEGRIYLASNQLDKARAAFNQAQEIDPGAVESVIGLSKTAFAGGNAEKARALLAEAEEIDGENGELWLWKAQLAASRKEWQTAEDAYIRALEDIGQYDVMTQRKYATISSLIRALRAQGKQSEAFVYEEILAKSAPGTIKSNLTAARDALQQGDLDNAARYLEEVLEQAPNHEQTALMLGLVRFRQGRVEDAEKLLAPIAEAGNSDTASKLLAATRLQMRNPEGAQAILENLENKDSDPETLAMVAIATLASGDLEAGEALMDKALASNPENHQLRLQYATYLNQRGEHERAITEATRALENAPDLEQARSIIIEAQARSGNMSAAKQTASQWIEEAPESITALITRGNLAATEGETEEARKYFTRARDKAPQSPTPVFSLGKLAFAENNREEARKHFREAVQLAPDSRQALQGLVAVQDREETKRFMRQILDENPEATGPRLVLLEAALRDNNRQEADDLTASLLERSEQDRPSPASPFVASIYSNIASVVRNSGEPDRASDILDRARALFPENEDLALQAAQQAFNEGKDDDARQIIQETKLQYPDSSAPYVTEATHFESRKEYQQAAELYQLALDKEPSAELANGYARNLQNSGKAEEALSFLESARETYPESDQLLFTMAALQQSEGKHERARENYEALLDAAPDNIVVLNNLAWLYHEQGDKRAIDLARKAYELNPENAAVADTYGWIMLKSGDHQASIPILEKAHELQPDSEEIALHLAEAYRTVGKNSDARRVLEKFGGQG